MCYNIYRKREGKPTKPRKEVKMVAIFVYECGLKFKGYARNAKEAKKALWNRYLTDEEKRWYPDAEKWFDNLKAKNNGVGRCYEILPMSHISKVI
jgi:hypothetical protein